VGAIDKDTVALIRAIGETPGYALADAKSGNFKARRLMLKYLGVTVPEASKLISTRSRHAVELLNSIEREIGWTETLAAELKEITVRHRREQTDPAEEITARLVAAYQAQHHKPAPTSEPTLEERREQLRHARTATAGGSDTKAAKAGKAVAGASGAPVVLIETQMRTQFEFIGPERAVELLVNLAPYQRKQKPDKVKEFTHKITEGEFVLMPSDAICIDWDGYTCNGQHRLEAVLETMKGQEFLVVYDVDPAVYDRMDRGTRRTVGDMLYGKSHADHRVRKDVAPATLGALLRMIHLWEEYPQDQWGTQLRNVTEQQVADTWARHTSAEESAAQGRLGKLKVKPVASMLAHYMIMRSCDYDATLVNQWYGELRQPRVIKPGDPGFALREYFLGGDMDRVLNRKALPSPFQVSLLQTYLILRAWENTCLGKPMQRMSWKPDFTITTAATPPAGFTLIPGADAA
jgi:hypothetical protein